MHRIIRITYCLVIFFVALSTLLLSDNLPNIWPVEYCYSNAIYYLVSILLVAGIAIANRKNMNDKLFNILFLVLTLAFLVLQIDISLWFPEGQHSDFYWIYKQAHMLKDGEGFSNKQLLDYFSNNPQNQIILYISTFILQLFGSWRAVIVFSSISVLSSLFFATLSIKNLTHNGITALIFYLFGYILIGLNWRAFLPYSDTFAISFPVICIYITTTNASQTVKILLISIFSTFSIFVKPTAVIPSIAILICYVINYGIKASCVKLFKSAIPVVICTYLFLSFANGKISKDYGFPQNAEQRGLTEALYGFFVIGQNNSNYGTVPNLDNDTYDIMLPFRKIYERGIFKNLKFYTGKTIITYRDGLFSSIQRKASECELLRCKSSGKYCFMLCNQKGYNLFVAIEQVVWNSILIMLLFFAFVPSQRFHYELALSFIGVFLYLMIFETRAKYLFMLLPTFIVGAAYGMHRMDFRIIFDNLKKK